MILDCASLNGFSQPTTDELIDIVLVFCMTSYVRFGSRVRYLQVEYLLLYELINICESFILCNHLCCFSSFILKGVHVHC